NVKESSLPPIERKQDMARLVVKPAGRGLSELRNQFSLPAKILMGVVGLVLLIACANVANLLLARGTVRQREITVRLVLGAGRWRLVRQLLTESGLLALAGALAGTVAGNWSGKLLFASVSTKNLPATLDAGLSVRVLLFTAAALVITVLLCGLIPALSATRCNLASDLKVQALGGAQGSPQHWLGKSLVVGQVALSVTVLVGAGLLLHSLVNLETFNVGFDRDHVLAISMSDRASSPTFYGQVLARAKNLPGIRSASYSSFMPLSGQEYGVTVTVEGQMQRSSGEAHALYSVVSQGYFETLGIPFFAGRDFTAQDLAQKNSVAIVNRTMARHYFGDGNALGKRLKFGEGKQPLMEIIGVVANSTYSDLREKPSDVIYLPNAGGKVLEVRASGNTSLVGY
ncbi:MAG: ABC transporter permease, partial [Candidatus Acidiferrum sp.]